MDKPKISVVIPCYNQEAFLEECIDSVLANPYIGKGEIIVVDDCSTDSSLLFADELARWHDLRILRHDSNKGPSATRNTGIAAAQAPIIVCIDADDKIPDNFLKKNYQTLYSDHVDVSYTETQCFGAETTRHKWTEYSEDHLRRENYISCSAMFKKEAWLAVGGFDETMRRGLEDYDFWLKLSKAGFKFKKCNETVLYWRKHTDNRTLVADQTDTRAEILAYLKEKHKGWYLGK